MKLHPFPALLSLFLAGIAVLPQLAHSETTSKAEAAKMKKAGIAVVPCPKYIAKLSSGLYTSINTADTVCINGGSGKKAETYLKKLKRTPFKLDGVLKGRAFEPIRGQEGDVNSDPFEEVNYPVAIHFDMTNADYSATYKFSIIDAETDKVVAQALKGRVPASGWVDWIGPGSYYFKTNALPDKEASQPVFDVDMEFMEPYEGFEVTKADIKDAEIKLTPCPKSMVDIRGNKIFSLKGYVCTVKGVFEDAGFTAAPYNLTTGLYLSQDISSSVADGAGQGFPFRILAPTKLTYSIDDPATADGKTGSTDMYLYNISTGKKTKLVSVKGSITATETYINIPGDYSILVDTKSSDALEYGDILWEISLWGSD